ncbi:type VII secretion protein EccB [Actinoplanes sp. NBRC 14428]|uniref:Type VII secretion protein EccB n=1 Tax=Pseudosporangium ferrugineum TaxID=439699 RepID=A0A2T0SEU0_9ACTN|nr:type VII secretion protein EccB [Pseudosporangium ferrugineum]PRY31932.1 type VII secretion protein EccB [Pseudosporangium ferrugineum]BCJ49830.1 type VII secretion protein EccB [Actinoplanes sp. NBRC 14428]
MWTQRDQLQAFQFLRRRIVSALQFGDANHPVAPGRRVLAATASGAGAVLLVCGGLLVLAVLRPGSTADWREPGRILIEKESGASFVLGADGLVHPVLNHASARLLIGGARTTTIAAGSLAGAPRGRPLGIPDAPASLAAPKALVQGPWVVCDGPGRAGSTVTTLVIGRPAPQRLPRGRGVIVAAGGSRHLLADGRRMRLRGNAVGALGWDAVRPRTVSTAWLDTVPQGPELALLTVPGSGGAGPELAGRGTRVGQVLLAEGVDGESRYYLATRAALLPIGQTEAALIVGNPANRAAYPDGVARPSTVSAADITASGLVGRRAEEPPYPARLPEVDDAGGAAAVLCAGGASAGPVPLWTARALPLPPGGRALPVPAAAREEGVADQVYVPPGTGLLLIERQRPGGPVQLVTDQGLRYPLKDSKDARALGYGDIPAVRVDAALLRLLPAGPELSAEAARQEAK